MDENVELTLLYEAYKTLLTSNMRDIFELKYYQDLSLREIGEEKNISYQAVNDSLKKVQSSLKEYENKLHLNLYKQTISKIKDVLKDKNNFTDNEYKLSVLNVVNILKELEE